jgi:hypothetical protein
MFNPNINYLEADIPFCSICSEDYEYWKKNGLESDTIEIQHPPACFWYDYFVSKLKAFYPDSKIIRKRSKVKKDF